MAEIIDFPQMTAIVTDCMLPADVTNHEVWAIAALILEKARQLGPDNPFIQSLTIESLRLEAIRNIAARHRKGER